MLEQIMKGEWTEYAGSMKQEVLCPWIFYFTNTTGKKYFLKLVRKEMDRANRSERRGWHLLYPEDYGNKWARFK